MANLSTTTTPYNAVRLRRLGESPRTPRGDYVLYWMQAYRRFDHNHALNYAAAVARDRRLPLVVYEGLKLGYPWASVRFHRFVLEGMQDNAAAAGRLGVNYWPFVETPRNSGRGLLRRLAERAAMVVTDDFPCFIVPEQTAALANRTPTPVVAVDGNCIVPLALLGAPASAAAHLRHRLHRNFTEAWQHRASGRLHLDPPQLRPIDPPFQPWNADDLDAFLDSLPLDRSVPAVRSVRGGSLAAKERLRSFCAGRLKGYSLRRSQPAPPEECPASGLSPYLHFGHLSIEEVVAAVLDTVGDWSVAQIDSSCRGKREGYFCADPDVNAFLDEAITWRDVGYHWHVTRSPDTASLERALPAWALATLQAHARDPRDHVYSLEDWEAAETHDPLWNAAQKELAATGTIHNYLRMLWGKKVIEWSKSPQVAYDTLVHLNNKYALDGRDPNSYTGILWCFGLFDRPWPPDRPVLGHVRYMSSENTARKFRLGAYLDYVASLAGQVGH